MNTHLVDFSASIASTREKQVLEKPFRTSGKSAYAVFVKDGDKIIRVNFNSQAAEDKNNLGPKSMSQYWASLVSAQAEDNTNHSTETLNQLSDFYYEGNYSKKEDSWDGYTFYSEKDILALMPELKLAPSVYTLNIPTNKGAATPSDTEYNSKVKAQLDKVAESK